MSIFSKVKKDRKAEQAYRDTVGFTPLESGVYEGVINRAYAVNSGSTDAIAVAIEATLIDQEGAEKKQNFEVWVTNGKGEAFYERNGKREVMSGWMAMNNLARLCTDGEYDLDGLEVEDYSYKKTTSGVDKVIKTEMYPELEGVPLLFAVIKTEERKREKDDNGDYVDVDEVYTTTRLDRVFNIEGFMQSEIDQDITEPVFIDKWEAAWNGKTKTAKPFVAPRGTQRSGGGSTERRAGGTTTGRKSRFDD